MTSSNGNIFGVTSPLCGEFTGYRWIPITKASDAELRFFFDLRLNKRLIKQSRRGWFETLSRSLWRNFNGCRFCSLYYFFFLSIVITVSVYGQTHSSGARPSAGTPMTGWVCMDRHFMMTSRRHDMEMLSAFLTLCEGNLPVTGGLPS